MILPDTDADGAAEVARLVRDALLAAVIPHPGGIDKRVTVSIGITTALTLISLTGNAHCPRRRRALPRQARAGAINTPSVREAGPDLRRSHTTAEIDS